MRVSLWERYEDEVLEFNRDPYNKKKAEPEPGLEVEKVSWMSGISEIWIKAKTGRGLTKLYRAHCCQALEPKINHYTGATWESLIEAVGQTLCVS